MKSIIIAIGDELLIGQVVNTNASFIAEKLNGAGVEVVRMLTVPDDEAEIIGAFDETFPRHDVTIVTGGLGPTHDDVTKRALCRYFHTDLVSNPEVRKQIGEYLRSRNHTWSHAAEEQTLVPRGSVVIPNHLGTAPGELFERDGRYMIVMPGVPHEMERMVEEFVVPFFGERTQRNHILHRTLNTTGIPESALAERLGPAGRLAGPEERLAFLPSPSGVRLRITLVGGDRASAERRMQQIESAIRQLVGKYIYGADLEKLEEVVGTLLRERGLTIAVAESCTGGMIADRITDVPGSSDYLERCVVAYSNQSKINLLRVPPALIAGHGAVSKEIAEAMALGVRETAGTGIGLSTTGIAGPAGAAPGKPVGLVWIGYSDGKATLALKFHFGGERLIVKERATQAALDLVRRKLLGID